MAGGYVRGGGMHGGGHVWQGVCMAGGMCGRGACMVGGVCGGGHVWQGGMHGGMCGGHAWQEACMAGGMCGRGACVVVGGMHGRPHMPHWQILRDTVNERAVRILLECILVSNLFADICFVMKYRIKCLYHLIADQEYSQLSLRRSHCLLNSSACNTVRC